MASSTSRNRPRGPLTLGVLAASLLVACERGGAPAKPPADAARASSGQPALAARLVAEEPRRDFGSVLEGDVLHHTFVLRSDGSEPAAVRHVKRGCGCTGADLFRVAADGARGRYELGSPLEPGERLELTVTFETLGRPGSQAKPIGLYGEFDGGASGLGVVELVVAADVQPFLASEPAALELGRVLTTESTSGELELRVLPDAQGSVRRVRLELDAHAVAAELELDVEAVDPDAAGGATRFRLVVTTRENLPPGYRAWPIRLRGLATDGLPAPEEGFAGEAVVRAQILGVAEPSPNNIGLGALRANQAAAATGEIVFNAETALDQDTLAWHIEVDGEDVSDAFTVELGPRADGSAGHAVNLRTGGLPAGLSGPIRGRISARLDHPAQAEVVLGVSGMALGT